MVSHTVFIALLFSVFSLGSARYLPLTFNSPASKPHGYDDDVDVYSYEVYACSEDPYINNTRLEFGSQINGTCECRKNSVLANKQGPSLPSRYESPNPLKFAISKFPFKKTALALYWLFKVSHNGDGRVWNITNAEPTLEHHTLALLDRPTLPLKLLTTNSTVKPSPPYFASDFFLVGDRLTYRGIWAFRAVPVGSIGDECEGRFYYLHSDYSDYDPECWPHVELRVVQTDPKQVGDKAHFGGYEVNKPSFGGFGPAYPYDIGFTTPFDSERTV
jgi:hypothetical protein